MIVLDSNRDLYNGINNCYGHSEQWISGLAKELNVSYNAAAHLTIECGYTRHKLTKSVTLEEFTKKPYASYIIKKKKLKLV